MNPDAQQSTLPRWPALEQALDFNALAPGVLPLVQAIAATDNLPERLAKMALLMRERALERDARLLARAAIALAPEDYRIRVMTDWLVRREAPLWHFGIVHDNLRNEAYARALEHFVKPGMTVFEIGTGTGILAMLAARAGARHVYTCERRADVAAAARAIIERNGLADHITVIAKDAQLVELGRDIPERADLFVAEIVDDTLLGEQVLPLTELARARFLQPGAILLPRAISTIGYLVSGRGHRERYRMGEVLGFDLSLFNRFSPPEIGLPKGGDNVEPLSAPMELASFDLMQDAPKESRRTVTLMATQSGMVEGVMRWLRLDFGEGIIFENRPPQTSSWSPILHVLPHPRFVRAGQSVSMEVSHTRDRLFMIPLS